MNICNCKISIIIPVYNAEDYIHECLISIKDQSHPNIEVILIDDGSIDKSGEIIKQICLNDERFIYIRQLNQGPASARNTGLKLASGEYIFFVDNDDLIAPKAINKMCRIADKYKPDIVIGNTLCFDDENVFLYRPFHDSKIKICSGKDYFCESVKNNHFTVMLYNYMYRKSFIKDKNLTFDINLTHEDELWTPLALLSANKVIYMPIIHYYYRNNPGSITNNKNTDIVRKDVEYISKKLIQFAETNKLSTEIVDTINMRIDQLKNYVLYLK